MPLVPPVLVKSLTWIFHVKISAPGRTPNLALSAGNQAHGQKLELALVAGHHRPLPKSQIGSLKELQRNINAPGQKLELALVVGSTALGQKPKSALAAGLQCPWSETHVVYVVGHHRPWPKA